MTLFQNLSFSGRPDMAELVQRRYTSGERIMLGVVLLLSSVVGLARGFPFALGTLLGCFLWGLLIYAVVWLAYAMLDKQRKPDRTRFVLICAVVLVTCTTVVQLSSLAKESDAASKAESQAASDRTAQAQREQAEAQAREAEAQAEARAAAESAAYKAAIMADVKQINQALETPTLSEKVLALHQIDVSSCPPDFRTAWVDVLYDMDEIERIDEQQTRLASEGNVDNVLIRQAIQLLGGSKDSALGEALTQEQQLKNVRAAWTQKLTESNRSVARVAAQYGVNY